MQLPDLSEISKAVAGGLVTALIALLARYGFQPSAVTVNAVGVIFTALISYAIGHIAVYFAPANKRTSI